MDVPRFSSFEDYCERSRLSARVRSFVTSGSDSDVSSLLATIGHVAAASREISKKIISCMPCYTLHDEQHLLNLLGWLEVLTPDETLSRMPPLEVGLCILSVLVHDLGMALPKSDEDAILATDESSDQQQAYQRFAEGRFSEEIRLAKLLTESGEGNNGGKAHLIHQHILAEYLRSTHATPGSERIGKWLAEMKQVHGENLFHFAGTSYEPELRAIAASHNQTVEWLRGHLKSQHAGRFHWLVRSGERVNFALPGLLLRLADIMDFDSSRTPTILYRHLGLREDLGVDMTVSQNEWQKHLAITGIDRQQTAGGETIVYAASDCPHPVVEKSIRQFVGWIQEEFLAVRGELARQNQDRDLEDRFDLTLPEVKHEIKPRQVNGQKAYEFQDIQFQLDQDEILQLLMGENLYGDPSLCIRELLQNALDACELRDLRLQLRSKGGMPAEAVDGTPLPEKPGFFRDSTTGQEVPLEVHLTWGFDDGRQQYWLQVEDNGVGMTEEAVKRYFTQIGKSFYRSPEFKQEQTALRSSGLFSTPISQFGIGILSCFMLADQIEVRTCPGGAAADRPAKDITISGPGSLFWLRAGTRSKQGTEVRLWLKQKLNGQELLPQHDSEVLLDRLREYFEYPLQSKLKEDETDSAQVALDPVLEAAKWIVWPRYPLQMAGPGCEPLTLDDRFHVDTLAPIDVGKVQAKAQDWDIPADQFGEPCWGIWDWTDEATAESTGSRIRLWFPQHGTPQHRLPVEPAPDSGLIAWWRLAAFVEPQLQADSTSANRDQLLLQGIAVPENSAGKEARKIVAGVGARVWIDLRGAAGLRLTADRKTMVTSPTQAAWQEQVDQVFSRFLAKLKESVEDESSVYCLQQMCSGLQAAESFDSDSPPVFGSWSIQWGGLRNVSRITSRI